MFWKLITLQTIKPITPTAATDATAMTAMTHTGIFFGFFGGDVGFVVVGEGDVVDVVLPPEVDADVDVLVDVADVTEALAEVDARDVVDAKVERAEDEVKANVAEEEEEVERAEEEVSANVTEELVWREVAEVL